MAKETIVFQLSDDFKEVIATKAQEDQISVGELIRRVMAEALEYDLADEPSTERRRKYATVAERNKAMRERAKVRRAEERELLEALRRADRDEDIKALRDSLKKKES